MECRYCGFMMDWLLSNQYYCPVCCFYDVDRSLAGLLLHTTTLPIPVYDSIMDAKGQEPRKYRTTGTILEFGSFYK